MIKQLDKKYMWKKLKFENNTVDFEEWLNTLPKSFRKGAMFNLMNSIFIVKKDKIDNDLKYNAIIMFHVLMDAAIRKNLLTEKGWKKS